MSPRVSVVMPVYNGARYIGEAVRSVLASTFRDFELLILDDGSTDGSVDVANAAAAGDSRVRVLRLAHGGVAAARNAGLAQARGEFIANLDSDDAMFPDRLRQQVAFLDRRPEYVAVGSRALVVDAASRPVMVGVRHFTHDDIDRAHMAGLGGAIWNPTATFRKAAALACGGYLGALHTTGEDFDLWLRMAETGKLANLEAVLVRYRVHDANASLAPEDAARRLAVTLETLARAYARRGITNRTPSKAKAPVLTPAEQARDRALLAWFQNRRGSALIQALSAVMTRPAAPATVSALKTILRGGPPSWTQDATV